MIVVLSNQKRVLTMTHEVKVTLHSPQGTRTTEVPPRGFPTRHIRTTSPQRDPGLIPSIFEPVETPYTPTQPTPEPTPVAETPEIRIYAEDCLTGQRTLLFTGQHTDDTADLCQAYATLAECRVECHDAVSAKVYHPDTYPIPTLNDWVEVVNADTGELIFVGLREKGFDARCRTYADRTGTGLRVDSAHENRSTFYTPRSETARYARENAIHFARKYGVPVADAIGMVAITAVAWASYVVMGVC